MQAGPTNLHAPVSSAGTQPRWSAPRSPRGTCAWPRAQLPTMSSGWAEDTCSPTHTRPAATMASTVRVAAGLLGGASEAPAKLGPGQARRGQGDDLKAKLGLQRAKRPPHSSPPRASLIRGRRMRR